MHTHKSHWKCFNYFKRERKSKMWIDKQKNRGFINICEFSSRKDEEAFYYLLQLDFDPYTSKQEACSRNTNPPKHNLSINIALCSLKLIVDFFPLPLSLFSAVMSLENEIIARLKSRFSEKEGVHLWFVEPTSMITFNRINGPKWVKKNHAFTVCLYIKYTYLIRW